MAAESQPRSGALAVATAGPAGSAVETRHAATAALSHPPGIAAPAKRPRRMGLRGEVADGGENLEDHPALGEQIRPPHGARFSAQIIPAIRFEAR
jgi:hypothetical protein